jgi:hypothetical protein
MADDSISTSLLVLSVSEDTIISFAPPPNVSGQNVIGVVQ